MCPALAGGCISAVPPGLQALAGGGPHRRYRRRAARRVAHRRPARHRDARCQGPLVSGREPRGRCWGSAATPSCQPGDEDRMTTSYLTSPDGLRRDDHGEVRRGAAAWDERGARVAAVLQLELLTVLCHGRRTAAENWLENHGTRPRDFYFEAARTDGPRVRRQVSHRPCPRRRSSHYRLAPP